MQKGSFKEDFDDWVSSDAESEIKMIRMAKKIRGNSFFLIQFLFRGHF